MNLYELGAEITKKYQILVQPRVRVVFKNSTWGLSYCYSIMFNPGPYFLTLDLTKTKVLLNLGLTSFVIRAIMST